MVAWLKLGYHTEAREDVSYWKRVKWVSDGPGRQSPRWKDRPRPGIGDTNPPYGPKYAVGDRLVMYLTGPRKCPAILEVASEPRWDPDRIDRESKDGEGDRWGVLTEVVPVHVLPLTEAPPLERLDVVPRSIAQKGHVHLESWQYEEAERLIGGTTPPPEAAKATAERISVEGANAEGYDVQTRATVKRASRREAALVRDYAATLRAKGDSVSSNRLTPAGTSTSLRTDLFNWTRNQLVEAKAGTERGDIRMAIGQLADYAYLLDRAKELQHAPERAVLLEARPHPGLIGLLEREGIGVIWREGDSFADNASGAFT